MIFDDSAYNNPHEPSDVFLLENWKLTLPVSSSGKLSGKAAEIKHLGDYEKQPFFFLGEDDAMVFSAPVAAATTKGSHYARSELRELENGHDAAWRLSEGGTMTATVAVNELPTKSDGKAGKVVIGQIHGPDDELCRLYFDNGSLYFVDDKAGSAHKETRFNLLDEAGHKAVVPLNAKFEYSIDADPKNLTVSVKYDGHTYKAVDHVSSFWKNQDLYFKAGAYLGVGKPGSGAGTTGRGTATVSFYDLDVSHD